MGDVCSNIQMKLKVPKQAVEGDGSFGEGIRSYEINDKGGSACALPP